MSSARKRAKEELSGLESLKALKNNKLIVLAYSGNLSIIEKELKRLKQLDIMYSNCVIKGTKQKKAFDFIKELCDIKLEKLEHMHSYYLIINGDRILLTEEQYDLIREVI